MRLLFLSVRALWCCCLVLLLPGCIDPYMPDAISSNKRYLVVDGFINSRGITTILLSRTYDIAAKTAPPVETGATVFVEEEGGTRYPLRESTTKGTYTSASLTLNPAKNYRLSLRTTAGKDYASEFVPAKITPPIDNVTWQAAPTGLNIYVNSHDDTKQTQYYRWEYEETWEIVPMLQSSLEYLNFIMQPRRVYFPEMCWGSAKSTDIKLSRTNNLTQDVVSNFALRSYSTSDKRLRHRYSILVKQYAQTAMEYQYWEMLKKNTESIGTLFDPQPTQLTGNVRCLNDASELAVGYVGAHSVEQKRIFITRSELPFTWRILSGYDECVSDTVELKNVRAVFGQPSNIPLYEVDGGYLGTTINCVDCRLFGSAVKPSFWP